MASTPRFLKSGKELHHRPKYVAFCGLCINDSMKTCTDCKHYYITWDKKFPYGCRAMGFKSHEAPSLAVYKSSGIECLLFVPKDARKKDNIGKKQKREER